MYFWQNTKCHIEYKITFTCRFKMYIVLLQTILLQINQTTSISCRVLPFIQNGILSWWNKTKAFNVKQVLQSEWRCSWWYPHDIECDRWITSKSTKFLGPSLKLWRIRNFLNSARTSINIYLCIVRSAFAMLSKLRNGWPEHLLKLFIIYCYFRSNSNNDISIITNNNTCLAHTQVQLAWNWWHAKTP